MALPELQGELWAWVQSLPPWQSDLLRRLTTLEDFTPDALDDAVRMVMTAHDVPMAPAASQTAAYMPLLSAAAPASPNPSTRPPAGPQAGPSTLASPN